MEISVLVPVLGRPQNARPLLESLRASGSDATLVFVCAANDLEQLDACRLAVSLDRSAGGESEVIVVEPAEEHDYPRKMNIAFRATDPCEWVLLGSDDVTFEAGWVGALEHAARSGKRVLGTNDKANRLVMQGKFSTHTLVARSYVEEFGGCLEGPGFLVSEAYDHNFVDRELACLAIVRSEWMFVQHAIVRHRHPAFGSAPQDATYVKGRETFLDDQLLFWERAEQWGNIGLIPQELAVKKRSSRRIARQAATARARKGNP